MSVLRVLRGGYLLRLGARKVGTVFLLLIGAVMSWGLGKRPSGVVVAVMTGLNAVVLTEVVIVMLVGVGVIIFEVIANGKKQSSMGSRVPVAIFAAVVFAPVVLTVIRASFRFT